MFQNLLQALYPEDLPHALVLSGPVGGAWVSDWCSSIEEAVETARRREEGHALYFGLSLMDEAAARKRAEAEGKEFHHRGGADLARGIGALWAEVDVRGPGHKAEGLPPSLEAARELLDDGPTPVSALVASGGGLHAYWLLHELWELPDEAERAKAHGTLLRLQGAIRAEARARGWTSGVDPVADLARVLRVPGSWNRKDPERAKRVELLELHPDRRYDPVGFEIYPEIAAAPRQRSRPKREEEGPPARYRDIVAGCPWLAHCVSEEGARSLPEPAWYAMASLVGRSRDGELNGEALFHRASRPYPKYRPDQAAAKLERALEHGPVLCARVEDALGGAEFCAGCRHRGVITSPIQLGRSAAPPPPPPPEEKKPPARKKAKKAKEVQSEAPCTEAANATRFVALAGKNWLHCQVFPAWLYWDGCRFARDRTNSVIDVCRRVVPREIYRLAGKAIDGTKEGAARSEALSRWASASQSSSRIRSTLDLAKADPKIRVAPEDLDENPMLLNLSNGMVDLEGNRFYQRGRAERPRVTKVTNAPGQDNAECPRWSRFLEEIFLDEEGETDRELIAFVQRAVGYSLTGVISEHVLFLLFGRGSNGKTVFLETIAHVLGCYAEHIDFTSLLADPRGRPKSGPNEAVARLRGARFVVGSEADAGARFSESTIKRLTGGDKLAAEFKYGHQFSFLPSHKLWLAVNDRPSVWDSSHGFWRRIQLIPFRARAVVPEKAKEGDLVMDPKLPKVLRAEAPGILRWALEGLVAWKTEGLGACQAVSQETEAYRMEEDPLADFLGACCEFEEEAYVTSSELYAAYAKYCEDAGEKPLSANAFGRLLSKKDGVSRPVSRRLDGGSPKKVRLGLRLSLTGPGGALKF